LLIFAGIIFLSCHRDIKPKQKDIVESYQLSLEEKGPQKRLSSEGLESLKPAPQKLLPELELTQEPNKNKLIVKLSVKEAILRTLANNPQIKIVCFGTSAAREDITKAVAEFDPTVFGRQNYGKDDNPADSTFYGGQSESRLWEAGIKQKNIFGSELSASYAFVRNWDNLTTDIFSTRYEPMLLLQMKQPLLRDGWTEFNRAGINIAKLSYEVTLKSFRQKVEETASKVVNAYWNLVRAKKDVEIQKLLLEKTKETLNRLESRKDIDATVSHIKQAETFLKMRESMLLESNKEYLDIQETLVRLLSDAQICLLDNLEIVPTTNPVLTAKKVEFENILLEAMAKNPVIQQARINSEIARIMIKVAENQKLLRLDLIATAGLQGLDRSYGVANSQLSNGDYVSYTIGVYFEYPLGNRGPKAELEKRKLELFKAISILHKTSDQIALRTKEVLNLMDRTQRDIQLRKDAAKAAEIYLEGLENMELIRTSLTPEFLFLKLQAQELLANAQRAEIKSIVDFNIAEVQLAEITGTVLELHEIQSAVSEIDK
jgi:outer membrane protein TolC